MHDRAFVVLILAGLFLVGSTLPAHAAWLQAKTDAGVAHFLYDGPLEIQRYDMIAEQWLPPIPLSGVPTAFTVDSDGIFVAFGRRTARLNMDGTGETHLQNTASDVREVITGGSVLYLIEYGGVTTSVDKNTGARIDQKDYWYSMRGVSIAPTVGKLFGRSSGVSPSDIVEVVIGAGGTLGVQNDSRYHGDFPGATRTFVFPGEARVADDAGIVYTTNDLTYNNSLAGSFDDLSFYGDVPVILRGDTLYAYTNTFRESGRHRLDREVERIAVHGETIYAFYEESTAVVGVVETLISELSPPDPGQGVSPVGLAYTLDQVEVGTDGILYILSKAHLSVFRWSIEQQAYLDTIPLVEAPRFMTYSPVSHRLYFAYPSGVLAMMDLSAGLQETPFANSPQSPCGLATAGEYLFVCDPSGAWVSHFTYDPSGRLISQVEWNYYSNEYIWSQWNRKMYFFRDGTSPNDILWEDIDINGVIGTKQDSPYHSSMGIRHPIRVAPDGSVVVLGSGRIYDAISLVHTQSLSNEIMDGTWLNGQLFTLRSAEPWTEVQRWAVAAYGLEHSFFVQGDPIRIFPLQEDLLIISSVGGMPSFWVRGPDAGDIDGDQVQDHLDNCPNAPNLDQADTDSDGVGDACNDHEDADGDEWADGLDNCPDLANVDQTNPDGDDLGDACDPYPDHDLRVQVSGPEFGVAGIPVEMTFQLQDPQGAPTTDLTGVRVTLTLDGSATFGSAASVGTLLDGGGTGMALVEFTEGLVVIDITDTVEETVTFGGDDTEAIGIAVISGTFEEFEANDGGFTHSGTNDVWERGIPISGPGAAYSKSQVWATNLAGNYPNNADCTLQSPIYPIPAGVRGVLEFQSWFDSEYCCDFGYVEISTNNGASWRLLERLRGNEGGYTLKSYDLYAYSGQGLIVRFRLSTNGSFTDRGWYIDDFAIGNIQKRVQFIAPHGDIDEDGLENLDEIDLGTDPFDPDTDDDAALDGVDNCPRTYNPAQEDAVHPNGVGDSCEDPDLDLVVDLWDNCPDTPNADQADQVHPNGIGDACEDPDTDGVFDLDDNCPDTPNAEQDDGDGDLVGTACDICPTMHNPGQAETAACIAVSEDGGQCLETEMELIGEAVDGEITIYESRTIAPDSIRFDILATTCDSVDQLELRLNGTLLGVVSLDPAYHCACLTPLQSFIVDDAALLESVWSPSAVNWFDIQKAGVGSAVAWVRVHMEAGEARQTECILSHGPQGCSSVDLCAAGYVFEPISHQEPVPDELSAGFLVSAVSFFGSELPGLVNIETLTTESGTVCVVRAAPDGAVDCVPFTHSGEHDMAINGVLCGEPSANAGANDTAECMSGAGAMVTLDGSGSTDPNSTPGTNDDIVQFEWFEHFGTPEEALLAEGRVASATLPLGTHEITLRVTDSFGYTATDEVVVTVVDTTAPNLSVTLGPDQLWPANHKMVTIHATIVATDACGGVATVLTSVTSSDPDDATGGRDGNTVNDIQDAEIGTLDTEFRLRAERWIGSPDRAYTVTYTGEDESGNAVQAASVVTVARRKAEADRIPQNSAEIP